ncbi:hypothetical protein DM01DRAFT_1142593 [Hesseltinella vesiculosa]|uniref:TRP C-terminal domain-containing protein n=1 Tax=Hesseltinella vesiculosa TaxID=101127 RepID=A0A1X2G7S3_9FUNG|nr:hypothetical protein DM01DRAFT_1142593 [Hesseltinella vesiculosa]
MLFLLATIFVPMLIVKYWQSTVELLRFAHFTFTPTITPPTTLALIGPATTSPPSPLAIVGEVTDNFAADFALALCGMVAFLALYVLVWAALRFDLSGKIKDGAVLVARRLLGLSSGALCLCWHLAVAVTFVAVLVVSKVYDLVLVCLSAAVWCCLVLFVTTLALVWMAKVLLSLAVRVFCCLAAKLPAHTTPAPVSAAPAKPEHTTVAPVGHSATAGKAPAAAISAAAAAERAEFTFSVPSAGPTTGPTSAGSAPSRAASATGPDTFTFAVPRPAFSAGPAAGNFPVNFALPPCGVSSRR